MIEAFGIVLIYAGARISIYAREDDEMIVAVVIALIGAFMFAYGVIE